jgi:hypothetical protein
MPRYLVERTFTGRLTTASGEELAAACGAVVDCNADVGVTWVHSYMSDDGRRSFCIYDGPSPEAVRRAAERNKLPVDRITRVRVLDPYSYR